MVVGSGVPVSPRRNGDEMKIRSPEVEAPVVVVPVGGFEVCWFV